ncbi:MAG: bacteriocin [Candidatus Scatovivens sp.]
MSTILSTNMLKSIIGG